MPEGTPPQMAMMHDHGQDDALEARLVALERFAQEVTPYDRARDDEVDMLTRKVASLEDVIMRFMSEVPIRLGGEIGVLERRIAYLSDELPARLHAESDTATETVERLDRKVVALERFAQAIPSARWHHDHDARSEALERRVVELEKFCTALARRGTAPREIAATTTAPTASAHASGKMSGLTAIQSTVTRDSASSAPATATLDTHAGEQRRGRK